jgi:hypothetical protein
VEIPQVIKAQQAEVDSGGVPVDKPLLSSTSKSGRGAFGCRSYDGGAPRVLWEMLVS